MNQVPSLQTGAVMQYPGATSYQYSTQALRFVDGSEQRFRDMIQPVRRWSIQLDRLSETEMNSLREFFRLQAGGAGTFSFTDPWNGTSYPNCCLETSEMTEIFSGVGQARTTLVVKANLS
jgi:phage-related protein